MITDLWKYVFNAMECRSNCCEGAIQCKCISHQIEIESDDDICNTCLGCNQSDYTDSSGGEIINNDS